jgi:hypothetical protein
MRKNSLEQNADQRKHNRKSEHTKDAAQKYAPIAFWFLRLGLILGRVYNFHNAEIIP